MALAAVEVYRTVFNYKICFLSRIAASAFILGRSSRLITVIFTKLVLTDGLFRAIKVRIT